MSKFLDGRDVSFWIGEQPTDIETVVYNELPRASGNFQLNRTFADDTTITNERSSKDSVLTGTSVSGDMSANMRLSDHYTQLRQSALQAHSATVLNFTGALTYTHSGNTLAGGDFTVIKENDYFGVTLDSGETKIVRARSNGTATNVVISGLDADATATAAKSTKFTSGDNQIPFMLQRRAVGTNQAGDTAQTYYRTFTGVEVFSYTQSLAQESILTESFTMTGVTLQEGTDKPTQGSDSSMPLGQVLGAVKGVESIWFDGEPRKCFAQSIELSIDNQGSEAKALGQSGACFLAYGDPIITGSVSVYSLKSNPYEFDALADAQTLFNFAYVLYDVATDKRMVVSGMVKATTVDSPAESGPLITSLSLKYIGQISFTYI